MNSININKVLNLSNITIVDVRSYNDYLEGHIPGAIFMDYYKLLFNPEKYLNKDKSYYFYCFSGSRSLQLVDRLNRMGYHCINILGGYQKYLLSK